ncbi:MAG: DUF1538 domain-containing protein [Gammaproteobacteria bacterium]|nr:DUF1538 domain-containing protein [Gammaproteobacteria bacterium]TVQ48421.1 MAG: DUF1538 domain-containing protein [Gammaproteobacteria bacterium]
MRRLAREFFSTLLHALRNLLPIVLVVSVFQFGVLRQVPDGLTAMIIGLGIVVIGVALFLQGLEMGIFPIARSLADEFTAKGSLPWLMIFGFFIGFSAVIAEPALIAVAEQAELISEGRIDPLILRVLVATSVGAVVAIGVLRIILGLPLHWMMIGGYITVVIVTFFAPEEIVGLAYDSGGVTTNIVTVPLIAALGLGLAAAIRGRNPLIDGFGLVALSVMVPMITVQLYGVVVFTLADPASVAAGSELIATLEEQTETVVPGTATGLLLDLGRMMRDVLPIILVVLVFQYVVIRKRIPHLPMVTFGFVLVIVGLYAFVVGLKLGLFPIGENMAEQLIAHGSLGWLYLFAFSIGFATTMAEPALIAIGDKAEEASAGRIRSNAIRLVVALGVATGITIGVHRIITGDSIHLYIIGGYAIVILLTFLAPRYIIALAYDLGGVTTSEVTVPLITALGIGLATNIEGRSVMIDGFGLIAFASIFPIVSVMLYAILADFIARQRGATP